MAAWWNKPIRFGPPMNEAWQLAGRNLVVQSLLVILAGMNLDTGVALRYVTFASLCWWIVAAVILLRRSRNLSRGDRMFLKIGFLLTLAISVLSTPAWGWLRPLIEGR